MPVSRRHFFLGSLALPALADKKPAPDRSGVLLILVDEVPRWMLGCYGNQEVRTPHLDRLAQAGTRLHNHFAAAPAPGMSAGTLLTGRTPMQLGHAATIPSGEVTVDKILGGLGYAAASAGETATALQFLDGQSPGKPFLLTVRYSGLRPPYGGIPQKYLDLYSKTTFETFLADPAAVHAPGAGEMLADRIGNLRKVSAGVTQLDDDVAALLAKLSQRGLRDTLVVFTSTCGAMLGRHGLWSAGDAGVSASFFDDVVNTPMIWHWPGHVGVQGIRPEMVSAYDLVPTLCELLGAPLPSRNLCGRSYAPLITGKPLPKKQPWRTTVFGECPAAAMAHDHRYKLVEREQGRGASEFYDLPADPRERANQYDNGHYLNLRNELAGELAAWKQKYSA